MPRDEPTDAERAQEIKDAAKQYNNLVAAAKKDGIHTEANLFESTSVKGIVKVLDVTVYREL